MQVRAILQWAAAPPANTPSYIPVWGNVLNVQVQIHPVKFCLLGDLVKELEKIPIQSPIRSARWSRCSTPPQSTAGVTTQPLSLRSEAATVRDKGVPVHRSRFRRPAAASCSRTRPSLAGPGRFGARRARTAAGGAGRSRGKLFPAGRRWRHELRGAPLRRAFPESDLIEAVLTVKKSTGYSAAHYAARARPSTWPFWIDFFDGNGFQYMGTPTVNVHDLQEIPEEDVQYSVFLKKDLSKYRVPCEPARGSFASAPSSPGRRRRRRGTRTTSPSGATARNAGSSSPGALVGHVPLIDTVGDIVVDHIDPARARHGLWPDRPLLGARQPLRRRGADHRRDRGSPRQFRGRRCVGSSTGSRSSALRRSTAGSR